MMRQKLDASWATPWVITCDLCVTLFARMKCVHQSAALRGGDCIQMSVSSGAISTRPADL
jgi:hypothetical protein